MGAPQKISYCRQHWAVKDNVTTEIIYYFISIDHISSIFCGKFSMRRVVQQPPIVDLIITKLNGREVVGQTAFLMWTYLISDILNEQSSAMF